MKNTKRILSALLVCAMLLALCACGSTNSTSTDSQNAVATAAPDDTGTSEVTSDNDTNVSEQVEVEPYNFNFSYGGATGSSMVAVAELLMEDLTELSGGAFTFTVYNDPNYVEKQALDELMNDIVDIVYLASSSTSTTISEVAYLGMPGSYRFTDNEEDFLDFEATLSPYLSDIFNDYGIHYLTLRAPAKMALVGTGDTVTVPSQLKGKIVRVAGTWLGRMMVALDIGTSTIAAGEQLTALERGTIDASITGIEQVKTRLLYEVADYCSILPETDGVGALVMDEDCWNQLTDAQKEVVNAAVELWTQQCIESSASFYQEVIDKLNEYDVEIVEVTDEDCDEWLSVMDNVYAEIDASTSEKGVALKEAMLEWRTEHMD